MPAKQSAIKDKSFAFAVRMIRLYQYLQGKKKEFVLSKQLLRSGTSIGANVREAEHAQSTKDFVHKLGIAQKEIGETVYWLELLATTDYLSSDEFESINKDAVELMRLVTSIIKSTKAKMKKDKTNNSETTD